MSLDTTPQAEIIALGAAELARQIAARQITSQAVIAAHIERITAIHSRLNALVVPLFDQARRDAQRADDALQQGRLLGPLHGVPFTAKECFDVAGTASTLGIARLAQEVAAADAPLVAKLKAAGAILLGKTNVSQLMLNYESDNPLYGRTNNPWNGNRSCGGSSGGEAALIAAGGSPLGLGTDLGGSIRQPAHSCGIHGFLPSPGVLTTAGIRSNLSGMDAVAVQPGIMARTVDDLLLAMRALTDRPMATVRLRGLKVAMWVDDGYFACSPAIRRAVHESAARLRAQGVTVDLIEPPDMHQAIRLFFGFLSADGGDHFHQLLGDSPVDWRIERLLRLSAVPRWLRKLMALYAAVRGRARLSELLRYSGRSTAAELARLVQNQQTFRTAFFEGLRRGGYQALLCPPYSLPALLHGSSDLLPAAASYCMLMNLLGVPCGVVTVTQVAAGEESDRPASRDWAEQAARRVEEGSAGLPIAVQVAAPPGEDDLVLQLLSALDQGSPTPPI
ncbi:MAG TPA: amidase family protein [Pirellulales bacterium]|jgi:fatty acid amide hydrolase|nr:amidase family protein [Pirellulales bacterium]